MARFAVGQSVAIAFNPQTPDPRVPQQSQAWTDTKGRRHPPSPGEGVYDTKPVKGIVLEVHEREGAVDYLLEVELEREYERNGRKLMNRSYRKRVVPEAKLMAV